MAPPERQKQRETKRVPRRALLAGLAGGLAGFVTQAFGRSPAARAADGDPVLLGRANREAVTTRITNSTNGDVGLRVEATGRGSVGVKGVSPNMGVAGESVRGVGVSGLSERGDAVEGFSFFGTGVGGVSMTGFGVQGQSEQLTGVSGVSRDGTGVEGGNVANDKPAILGVAGNGATGVQGFSSIELSARPPTRRNTGIHGVCDSPAGTGVFAQSADGTALRVEGKAQFDRSGVLTVGAGGSSGSQAGISLSPRSLVLAILRQHLPGVHVEAVVPDVSEKSFTVFLSKTVSSNTKVAWFIVN